MMVIYEIGSNVVIELYETQYKEAVVNEYDMSNLNYKDKDALKRMIVKRGNELVDYLDDKSHLYEKVTSIKVEIEDNEVVAKVKAKEFLTNLEMDILQHFIFGQYSGGWGEEFKKIPFRVFEDVIELYDEDEELYYCEDTYYHLYAKFWNPDDFRIRIDIK